MDISILLSTYKRHRILDITLKSLSNVIQNGLSWEILLADNANDIKTKEIVASYANNLPIKFYIEKNPGKNNALNKLIPNAKGKLLLFIDDDIIVDSNWMINIWKGTERWPQHYVFGGQVLPHWPYNKFPTWGEDNIINDVLYSLQRYGTKDILYKSINMRPTGANLAIRREIFESGYKYNQNIGPNGEKLFRMGSESELLLRLENDGYQAVYIGSAIVYHQIRDEQIEIPWVMERAFRSGFSDANPKIRFYRKYLIGSKYLWKRLIYYYFLYLLSMLLYKENSKLMYYTRLWQTRGKLYGERLYNDIKDNSLLQKFLKGNFAT